MTALPSKGDLNGSSGGHNQGMFKAAIGGLRDFLSGLLGEDGTQASALAALKVLDPQAVYNLKPEFTVGTNALTCTVKDRAGGDLSATNPGFIGQRSGTPGDGGFTLREIAANVALTISSGSTLGHSSGVSGKIYWYLLDNAGVQVLAACGSFKGFSGIYSTTAEGGAGAADSDSVLYAVGAHSNIPGRLIAVTTDSQTTAGTWANAPSQVDLIPQALDRRGRVIARSSNTVLGRDNHGDTINATATYTQTTAAAATLGAGWFIDIIVDSGATLTIDPNSTETVDGSATKAIVGPASGRLVCNGTLFRTIGFSSSPITTRGDLIRGGVGGAPERVALGSNRQILRSNGSDAAWATLDTFLSATATGASVEFNSLPENIGEIWINFVTVSTNGSVIPIVQLGNASAWVSSGYSGGIVSMSSSGPTIYGVSNSNGFKLDAVHSPAVVLDGCIVLSRYGGDFWQCSVSLARTDSNVPACGGGALNVGAPLTRIRLLMDGVDQFDSGGISIRYR